MSANNLNRFHFWPLISFCTHCWICIVLFRLNFSTQKSVQVLAFLLVWFSHASSLGLSLSIKICTVGGFPWGEALPPLLANTLPWPRVMDSNSPGAVSSVGFCNTFHILSHPLSWLNWIETNLYFMLCLSFGFCCTVDALWDRWGGGASRLCCVSASSSSLKPARLCPCFLCLSGRFCHLPHPQHYFCLFLARSFPITLIRPVFGTTRT